MWSLGAIALGFDPLDQLESLRLVTQAIDQFETVLDVAVEVLTMVPVIGERRVDLS